MRQFSSTIQRLAFLIISVIVLLPFSFRYYSENLLNDTGRYVSHFNNECSYAYLDSIFDPDKLNISWTLFDALTQPLCAPGNEVLFIFVIATFVPLALLLFGRWESSGILWALAIFLSVYSYELATNAIRQGLSIFFLLWAFYLGKHENIRAMIFVWLLATLFHTASFPYGPLVLALALSNSTFSRIQSIIILLVGTGVMLGGYLYYLDQSDFGLSYFEFKQLSYEDEQSLTFILFITLPIVVVFAARAILSHQIFLNEMLVATYSILLIIIISITFPYISYRFAITSFVLQCFISMWGEKSDNRQAGVVLILNIFMLAIYILNAGSVREVWFE